VGCGILLIVELVLDVLLDEEPEEEVAGAGTDWFLVPNTTAQGTETTMITTRIKPAMIHGHLL